MSKLHLFNPENDLALAAGGANYTPPKAAVALHRAAALLPMWYGESGDCVYAPDEDSEWVMRTSRRYGLEVTPGDSGVPAPWGWSAHAVSQFRRIGVDGPFPDVSRHRELSHRRTALKLYELLDSAGLPYELAPKPIEVFSVNNLPGGCDFYIKSPWSGSGRGVADCRNMPRTRVEELCQGIMARQGSVMVEPRLEKVRDFAMLFYSDGKGGVSYRGLSLFFNSSANAYGGNYVASQIRLTEMLGVDHLDVTSAAVSGALSELVGADYCGPLGVDMMLYRGADGRILICPTVEVNLRMTMGFVALSLVRFLPEDRRLGEFRIIPNRVEAQSGQILLLPPGSEFTFLLDINPR